jgi:hypothetical protein
MAPAAPILDSTVLARRALWRSPDILHMIDIHKNQSVDIHTSISTFGFILFIPLVFTRSDVDPYRRCFESKCRHHGFADSNEPFSSLETDGENVGQSAQRSVAA